MMGTEFRCFSVFVLLNLIYQLESFLVKPACAVFVENESGQKTED